MRLLSFSLSTYAVSALLLLLLGSGTSAYQDFANPELRLLNSNDFKSKTTKGMWLVEFFSPRCPHCRNFFPTWKDLAIISEHLEDSSSFYMAQVDCEAQGDLCETNDITSYPNIQLFKDGKMVEKYNGDRGFGTLKAWINSKAEGYRREMATNQQSAQAGQQQKQ
ncbi:thioredoxin-like protein [Tilletiaria anomala UBC 951]|uniref:Thioredoxin-like protein n=1 Tax=Tilletiaria anomala (strain ATCC 24038 / CBS 436.72 / UBC 951) TaxID=1037660 RepID=A0A066W6N4_TILAU|nr:thioredoxin-like protein [Tilletiaria anomala UBC 951]KDN48208.1 thioredoxin-like protein [Tilletiaria anomala UBC 951]